MTPTRIYIIRASTGDAAPRLVRAANPATALRHVAADTFAVAVAKQDDIVNAVTLGVLVETTSEAE